MKKLPISIDDFKEIITDNHCYVDKTDLIDRLATQGKYYFLSRPRRFGKSLLIDTIAQAFQGRKELFHGLYLENNWEWNKKHPVIHIDLADFTTFIPSLKPRGPICDLSCLPASQNFQKYPSFPG